ncbi:head-tail adaptor protein [Microvirga sp. SRT01]|uniref:Head-tail adaptor protein n=1 Tax=Sphingomonas longa TaxID=2778730 RepID=A0ABS2D739_9SPHN|nr:MULTISPECIES: head-tail adaptor protein [Alphaproteobacteria]MBM6576348.1 head-tail adaptor protein [Sphingomonas sp. BT552]MBR7709394.1 head-tail adaptor protein [Microvirga sp. SRT01]
MAIDARKLRDRVTIEAENLIDNGRGGRTRPSGQDAWKKVDTVWAECLALRGGEALQNLVERSKQLWRVTIRPRADLTTSMRLTWHDAMIGDVVGNIRSVAPNEDRDGLVMTVESGTT